MTDKGVKAPLHKDYKSTLPRVQNYVSSERYREVNLLGRVYPEAQPAGDYMESLLKFGTLNP